MKKLFLFIISTIFFVGAGIATKVYLGKPSTQHCELTTTEISSNNSSRSYSIDIMFNPEITTKKLELRTYNSEQELYDAFNIKKSGSNTEQDNTQLDKIPEYLAQVQALELKKETLKTLKEINKEWLGANASEQSDSHLVVYEKYCTDKSTFSIATELHNYAKDFIKRNNLPADYLDDSLRQYVDKYFELTTAAKTPKLMALIQRLAKDYSIDTPEIELSLTDSTSISSIKNSLRIGVICFMHFTDDEMEVVLAHEFAHLRSKHGYQRSDLKGGWFMIHGMDNNQGLDDIVSTLSRSQERQADSIALKMVKKPKAQISGLLKLARLSFIGAMNASKSHPTFYDRITYALAQTDATRA